MPDDNEPVATGVPRRSILRKGAFAGALAVGGTATMGSAAARSRSKTTGGVTYTAQNTGDEVKASFNAHGDDHPRGPRGRVNVRGHATGDFKGDVDCYLQDGNRAVFAGEADSGDRFRITVTDNGEPGWAEPNPDEIRVEHRDEDMQCDEEALERERAAVVESGNLVVHQ